MDIRTIDELVEELQTRKAAGAPPAIVLVGAGVSAGSIETAENFKCGLIRSIAEIAGMDEDPSLQLLVSKEWKQRQIPSYMTLELVMYFFEYVIDGIHKKGKSRAYDGVTGTVDPDNRFDVHRIIRERMPSYWFSGGNHILALLRREGMIGAILTANFDTLLYDMMEAIDTPFHLMSNATLVKGKALVPTDMDIVAFHGTLAADRCGKRGYADRLDHPGTVVARGLMRPFESGTSAYLEALFDRVRSESIPVLVYGYSGSDHYDMNVFISEYVNRGEGRKDIIPNLRLIWHDSSRYDAFSDYFWTEIVGNGGRIYKEGEDFVNAVLNKVGGAGTITQTDLDRKATEEGSRHSSIRAWAELLSGIDRTVAKKAIDMLVRGFPGAWAVTEHYTLESLGFDQKQIEALAGFEQPVRFLNVDVDDFRKAQKAYWDNRVTERLRFERLLTDEGLTDVRWAVERFAVKDEQSGLAALRRCQGHCDKMEAEIDRLRNDGIEPTREEIAMVDIFRSIAFDYEGLYYLFMSRTGGIGVEQRHALRLLAGDRFGLCATRALAAERTMAAGDTSVHLRDMVPYALWKMIGNENAARAMPDDDPWTKIQAFEICIRYRQRFLAKDVYDTPFERLAMYPQVSLRLTEAVKVALQWEVEDSSVRERQFAKHGRGELLEKAKTLLAQASTVFEAYRKHSSLRNYRFVSHFECRVAIALAEDRPEDARAAYDECLAFFRSYLAGSKTQQFLKTMANAVKARILSDGLDGKEEWRVFAASIPDVW